MRIAFVVNEFPAISEPFILRQITGLLDRGHELDIFAATDGSQPVTHKDIYSYDLLQRTFYLPPWRPSEPAAFRLMARAGLLAANLCKNPAAVLRSLNVVKFGKRAALLQVFRQIVPFLGRGPYDIVHCQFGPNGIWGALLRELGVVSGKLITTFHGYDVSSYPARWGGRAYADLFKVGDLFLCVSENMRAKLIRLGCDPSKIIVHRCGINLKQFRLARNERNTGGRFTVLTVARLIEKKGVEYGIQAVAKLVKNHPHIRYKIVGDGVLRNELEALIHRLGMTATVELLGWKSQDDVLELLRGADVFLAPSITSKHGDEEGIPTTIMEALASGVAVVSTKHSGIPELIQDGESGFLVPERDSDALAQKLESLLQASDLRVTMGGKGRRFVEEHHDIDKLNDRLLEIYQQLLAPESRNAHQRIVTLPQLT